MNLEPEKTGSDFRALGGMVAGICVVSAIAIGFLSRR